MLRSSHDACGCSTQTTSTINLKRSTLHPHEGQADRPNTPSDSVNLGSNPGLFSIRAVVVKRFQANNSNFCRSRARASLRDQPLALPAWDQQEETAQSDSRTDRGRAIDTRVQSELVSSIVPRGTSLRWIVAPTVWG